MNCSCFCDLGNFKTCCSSCLCLDSRACHQSSPATTFEYLAKHFQKGLLNTKALNMAANLDSPEKSGQFTGWFELKQIEAGPPTWQEFVLYLFKSCRSRCNRDCPNSTCFDSFRHSSTPVRDFSDVSIVPHLCIEWTHTRRILSVIPLPCVSPPLLFTAFIIICSIARSVDMPA